MTDSIHDIYLVARGTQQEDRKAARRRLMRAAMSGQAISMDDVYKARGLVVEERENSIFSDAWIPLAILFVIVGLAFDRNPALLALGFTLLLIVGVSTAWKNLSLLGVSYERTFDRTRVFPGEPIKMTLTVRNDKALPLTWLQFRDEMPVAPESETIISQTASEITGRYTLYSTFSLAGREKSYRDAVISFPTRGYYEIGPVTYESGDIFTLFTRMREHRYLDTLVVYPQIWPLAELGLPAKEPFGDVKVNRSLFTDPILTQSIRDYQPQDRFRDVHWKATARRGSLQTKVYDPSTGMTMAVFLNVATFPKHWMGFNPELLERAVSVAASIANFGVQQKWAVGVYANGSVPGSDQPIRVPPSRSPEQLAHVLEGLAAVTEFATASVEKMMVRESPGLPWAATIVLVTAVVTDEIMVALIRLKEAGRRVVLISLADDPPPHNLGRILAYHIPANVPAFQAGHRSATATEAALSAIPTPEPVQLELV
ncbi:MAG: DUF58 domain-containing protein [Ardenticatenaceae bacterium]|nr:DUF58 domain-containing protein [Ardenticatenaceae bacterium]MCB8989655.1 DUF58 domain-containing protein [Ardenticatenaceae bacterium]MCB9002887.1 DUF58 domain-containing protein [Ardenticatenaceae bacterium]